MYSTLSHGCQELGDTGFLTMLLWDSIATLRPGQEKGTLLCESFTLKPLWEEVPLLEIAGVGYWW